MKIQKDGFSKFYSNLFIMILLTAIIILLLILLLVLIYIIQQCINTTENWDSVLDTLNIPYDSSSYNEFETRRFIRLIGIERHAKLDKYNNIEKISYKKPEPELGETDCFITICPSWINSIICWKCE